MAIQAVAHSASNVVSGAKGTIKNLFTGKKKWFFIGAIVLVVILALFMGRKKQSTDTGTDVLYSDGYSSLPVQAGTSGGDVGGGESSDVDLTGISAQFTDQITELANSFSEQLNQSNQNLASALASQQSAFDSQFASAQAGFQSTVTNLQDQLEKQGADFDSLMKQYNDKASALAAANAALASSASGSSYSSPAPASSSKSASSPYISQQELNQTKQQVVSSGQHTQQTNEYISNLDRAESAAAVQNAANTADWNQQHLKEVQDKLKQNPPSFHLTF